MFTTAIVTRRILGLISSPIQCKCWVEVQDEWGIVLKILYAPLKRFVIERHSYWKLVLCMQARFISRRIFRLHQN